MGDFAPSVTRPGHNRLVRVYGNLWFIFALDNWFYGQNLDLGLAGVFMGGVIRYALTTKSVMAGNIRSTGISIESALRSHEISISIAIRSIELSDFDSIDMRSHPRKYYTLPLSRCS